jgi:hypothetical protein
VEDDALARIGRRHALAQEARLQDPADITRALVVLHGTDPASTFLSACARQKEPDLGALERALYDGDRPLIRVLGMRRTVFVVPADLAPAIVAGWLGRNGPPARKLLDHLVPDRNVIEAATRDVLAALARRGEATAAELTAGVPALAIRFRFNEGKAYEGSQSLASRLLFLLAVEGRIERGRPKGGIASQLHRWRLPRTGAEVVDALTGRARVIEAYLRRYGPATEADIAWWTGLPKAAVRAALSRIEVATTPLGLVLADDAEPVEPPAPWAALLPALDATPMGWTDRSRFLHPDDRAAHFDRSGNIGPTVWVDGRIVGGWGQRADGALAVRLLRPVGTADRRRIEERVESLRATLGPFRFKSRFRTPLERELTS